VTYLFPSLLWIGLPLVALPVLIHLINLLRRRRVRWAAMDFLLQSQKRSKNWVRLKQLLLLALRMTAIAAIALMVSQPLVRDQWGRLLGGAKTHHIVLLDDSFSMADRRGDSSAYERARSVVSRLAQQAAQRGGEAYFTVLRYSKAAELSVGGQPDVVRQRVDSRFSAELQRLLASDEFLEPAQAAAEPADALAAIERLPTSGAGEDRVIYVVSDFRAAQWNEPDQLRSSLVRLTADGTRLHLVHVVEQTRGNLAIASLRPQLGVRAAGVELLVEVAVRNFGSSASRQVAVRLEEDGQPRPGVVIDEIGPGETATQQFRVNFTSAGSHRLAAAIDGDAVPTDNRRYLVLETPESVPALLIDGSPTARDAYFLQSALQPGSNVVTGLRPRIEPPSFLRQHDQLPQFPTVFLLNVPRLDPPEVEALEQYVRDGGGLGIFVGELCQGAFYTEELYRDGQGLLPLPLTLPTDLLALRSRDTRFGSDDPSGAPDEAAPDLQFDVHPIFGAFTGMRNNPLNDVRIQRYFATTEQWQPQPDSTVNVFCRLRNGAPLAVEKKFGAGRVVAILTKASPEKTELGIWNDWARTHSFPPTILQLQGYLSARQRGEEGRLVGSPLSLALDSQQYRPQARFVTPASGGDELVVDAAKNETGLQVGLPETGRAGFYIARLHQLDGREEERVWAYNVEPEEGNLQTLGQQALSARLEGVRFAYHRGGDLAAAVDEQAGYPLSNWLLGILVAVLGIEQLLAYSAGYHPPRTEARS